MPLDGEEAGALVIEMLEKHLTREEQIPIAICFATAKPEHLINVFKEHLADRVLTEHEFVAALKKVPELVRSLELAS